MKARDLQPSYNFRQVLKTPGPPIYRRRVIVATSDLQHSSKCQSTVESPSSRDEKTVNEGTEFRKVDDEIRYWQKQRDGFKGWVEQRKALRKGIESIKFDGTWILNKRDKTQCEERVMERSNPLQNSRLYSRKISSKRKSDNQKFLRSAHIDMLPLIESPLPMALAVIADYLKENRLRLIDLFVKVDRDKDWFMTRNELKEQFKRIAIPLPDPQLDELVTMLDVNNDNQLSYKELSRGIDAYYKDRRWQKLKDMYDDVVAENDENGASGLRTLGIPGSKTLDKLKLPEFGFVDDDAASICIYLKKIAAETRASKLKQKHQQRAKRGKSETNNVKKSSFKTTLSGSITKNKPDYFRQVNEECKRCVDLLHANGIFVRSSSVRRVLVPPADNSSEKCMAHISSSKSIDPYYHPANVAFRRAQKRTLRKLEGPSAMADKGGYPRIDTVYDEEESNDRPFLPRVASFDATYDIAFEGQRRRRRIETASPTPFWPQHLLDKLTLCMDNCHIKKDGKSVLFNLVTGK